MTGFYHHKQRLFTPGPTPLLSGEEIIYHRSEPFRHLLLRCTELLGQLFGSAQRPVILTSSGTGAMEASLMQLSSPGDRVVVIEAGKFGKRWAQIASELDLVVDVLKVPWGQSVSADQVAELIEKKKADKKAVKVVLLQASETSTGSYHPIRQIAESIRQTNQEVFILVDAISSLGAHEMQMDSWQIDGVVSGSQKGFGVPPGLAFASLSKRGWEHSSGHRRYYFDLCRERAGQENGLTSWTPAITLIEDLRRTLEYWHHHGFAKVHQQHQLASSAVREAMTAMGLTLFAKDSPSYALTSVEVPQGIDGLAWLTHMKQHYGAVFAGGQEHLKGQIVRMAHLGFFDRLDLVAAVAAMEMSLKDLGYTNSNGGLEVLMEHLRLTKQKAKQTS